MIISDKIKVDKTQLGLFDKKGTVLESPGIKFELRLRLEWAWLGLYACYVVFFLYVALKLRLGSRKLKWQNPRSNPGPLVLAGQVMSFHHGTGRLLNPCSAFRVASFAKNSEADIFYYLESSKDADENEI